MRALLHLGAVTASLAFSACAMPLLPPPQAAHTLPAPPWMDAVTDSVALDAECASGANPQACRKLAVRFFRAGDDASARRALGSGCLGGGREACWRWGVAFLRADRVSQDHRLARAMFESACEGGSIKACRGLYGMLLEPLPFHLEPQS